MKDDFLNLYRKQFSVESDSSYDIPFYQDWDAYSFNAKSREEDHYIRYKMLKFLLRQVLSEADDLLLLSTHELNLRASHGGRSPLSRLLPKRDIPKSQLFSLIRPENSKLLTSFLLDENEGKFDGNGYLRHLFRLTANYPLLDKLAKSMVCEGYSGDISGAKNLKLEMLALYSPEKGRLIELYGNTFARLAIEDEQLVEKLKERFVLMKSTEINESFDGIVKQPFSDW